MAKIGVIGTGNMAGAILQGSINSGFLDSKDVCIYNRSKWRNEEYIEMYKSINVSKEINDLLNHSKYIIIGVKPYAYSEILKQVKNDLTKEHVIISIAAGVSIDDMQSILGVDAKIVRTMPNTPALVLEGMTAITYNKNIAEDEMKYVLDLFNQVGKSEVIEEKLMDIIPAVSGSSPAYVFMFIEALADGAVLDGMPRDKAYKFASQAVLGAAKMVIETNKHPGVLKDMVTSPGGTTIEAIKVLENASFRGTIINAMSACTHKSRNLNK